MQKPKGRPPRRVIAIEQSIESDWIRGKEVGERLPAERDLAEQYRAGRATIRAALERLEGNKLIVRRAWGGCFVSRFHKIRFKNFRGKTIAVSFAKATRALNDPSVLAAVKGIFEAVGTADSSLLLETHDYRFRSTQMAAIADYFFRPDHVMAVFLLGRHREQDLDGLQRLGKPIIAIDFDATNRNFDSFVFDNHDAGRILARRLHLLGHRRILGVFEPPDKPMEKQDEAWRQRREAFLAEWRKRKNPAPIEIMLPGRSIDRHVLGRIGKRMRLAAEDRPTALVLPTSIPVWTIRKILARQDIQIPRDLTVMGFDVLDPDPELTAVRFDGEELGRKAGERMLNLISNPDKSSDKASLIKVRGHYVAAETHARPES